MNRITITLAAAAAVLALTATAQAHPDRNADYRAQQRAGEQWRGAYYDHHDGGDDYVDDAPAYEIRARAPRFDGAVQAFWGNSWWDAEVISRAGGRYLIHYVGWSSTWDEWVGADRLRRQFIPDLELEVRPRIKVLIGGNWIDGILLAEGPAGIRVHYVGWSESWDEWVSPRRVRGASPVPIRRTDRARSASLRVEDRGGYSSLIARR